MAKETSFVSRVEPRVRPASGYAPFFNLATAGTVHGRFEEMACRFAGEPALTFPGETWSYARLNESANQAAWRLLNLGVKTGDRVALVASHRPESVAVYMGISKAGGVVVPLDPNGSTAQLTAFLGDCSPRVVVADPRNAKVAEGAAKSAGVACWITGDEQGQPVENPALPITPEDLFIIIYSSGTTGQPKGVTLTHGQRIFQTGNYADALGIGHGDHWSFLHSLHAAASVADFLSALLTGATAAMYDVPSQGLAGMADWIRKSRLTVVHWIPSGFRRFIATLPDEERFGGQRLVLTGSEPALHSDLAALRRHFLPPCDFVNRYAAAESGCFCYYVTNHSTAPGSGVAPIGSPVEGWQVEIVDSNGHPVPRGETGTITIRSAGLTSGYWNRPDLNHQVFRGAPGTEDRLWITSDLGEAAEDGTLRHLGRSDSVVKIRGRKVALLEVEAAIQEHPGVAEAAVVAREAPSGELRLIGYLVPRTPAHFSVSNVRHWLGERLAAFAVPEQLIAVEGMPRTRTGKLDRRALPDPGTARPPVEVTFAAPESPTEEALAHIWEDVLNVDRIGRLDPFLDLGGTSLAAGQIAARIFHEWGAPMTAAEILAARTISGLADVLLGRLAADLDESLLDDLFAGAPPDTESR